MAEKQGKKEEKGGQKRPANGGKLDFFPANR